MFMPICPYCETKISIDDFFEKKTPFDKKKPLKGNEWKNRGSTTFNMFFCPHCDKILGFSRD